MVTIEPTQHLPRHINVLDVVGFIPMMLDEDDPTPCIEQLDRGYLHGGGWQDFEGFTVEDDGTLTYPDDPPLKPWAVINFRDDRVFVYNFSWVMVRPGDGSAPRIARMD